MKIQPERIEELTKLASQPEIVHSINNTAEDSRPHSIMKTGRMLLGQHPLVDINELQPEAQEELLFVMRSIRNASLEGAFRNE